MPKGILTKQERNRRYKVLRGMGFSRMKAKQVMDWSYDNYLNAITHPLGVEDYLLVNER